MKVEHVRGPMDAEVWDGVLGRSKLNALVTFRRYRNLVHTILGPRAIVKGDIIVRDERDCYYVVPIADLGKEFREIKNGG